MTRTHPGPVSVGPGLGLAAGDIPVPGTLPAVIGVRGARHNNLGDVDADVPLWRTVAVAGGARIGQDVTGHRNTDSR
jgi:excinuclease UvrABC ATPase subunit